MVASRAVRPSARLALALLVCVSAAACGARTPFYEPRADAAQDVSEDAAQDVSEDVFEEPVAVDARVEDTVDAPAPEDVAQDTGPACEEGLPCTEGVDPCVIGRTRCIPSGSVCLPAGNQLPGTMCMGGTCDGRGSCRAGDQRSCPSASESGCGVVFLTGGALSLGDASGYRAQPTQPSITVGGFTLDAYEVTVARFQRFWADGHPAPAGNAVTYPDGPARLTGAVVEPTAPTMGAEACNWGVMGREYHPVNCVDWSTAQAFCAWDGGRIPTEAEWEYAARYTPAAGLTAGRRYPWGAAEPMTTCDRAHFARCMGTDGAATRRVGSFDNAAGLFDLSGNVWEWTADRFALYADRRCWGGAARTNPRCAVNDTGYFTIRGGSWVSPDRQLLQGSSRDDAYRPESRSALVGFRCARTRSL